MAMEKKTGKMLAVSLIFLMALSFTSALAYATNEAQKPSYSVGNEWKYKIEYLSASGETTSEGNITMKITGVGNVTVSSVEYECFIIEVESIWQSGVTTSTENSIQYIQRSDLGIVKEDSEQKNVIDEEIKYHLIRNITYSPPYEQFEFPIDVGNIWWANTTRTSTVELRHLHLPPSTSTSDISRNFTVVQTEKVTVPAGTFDTYVIEYTTGDSTYWDYYSPRANGIVKELIYDSEMNLTARMEMVAGNTIAPEGVADTWLLLIVGIVVVFAVVFVYFFFIRRRRS